MGCVFGPAVGFGNAAEGADGVGLGLVAAGLALGRVTSLRRSGPLKDFAAAPLARTLAFEGDVAW